MIFFLRNDDFLQNSLKPIDKNCFLYYNSFQVEYVLKKFSPHNIDYVVF